MDHFEKLLSGNRDWAAYKRDQKPGFFAALAEGQAPRYLWIGCADSRVPATQICGLEPGSVFVHRNIANLASPSDLSCQAVLQYAIDTLEVSDVIVCGHYCCGGVRAALFNQGDRAVAEWLQPLRELALRKSSVLETLTEEESTERLCEWNVATQVHNLGCNPVVRAAWARGRELRVHGIVYGVGDGLLKDLEISLASADECDALGL